ncbi:MAG: aromatic amino acid transaminase [Acidobacteriota bacterium]
MFETLPRDPPDPILGLTEAFQKDPNPEKLNLSAGVYQDAHGRTPIFESVKRAEERILRNESTKVYLDIQGSEEFGAAAQELIFGKEHEVLEARRAATAQTPGGTGGLRIAADFLKRGFPRAKIWLSNPTWVNHANVFQSAGLEVGTYPYMDASRDRIDAEGIIKALHRMPEGDGVVFHGCCHNPTGIDPTREEWERIAEAVQKRKLLALVDFAYQGLGEGICADAEGIRTLCRAGSELLVASSFSKNFGLYRERVGALTVVTPSQQAAENVLSQLKTAIRANYSSPPAHGAAIVITVLADPELRRKWVEEVDSMRRRIRNMRELFVRGLNAAGAGRDFSFVTRQRGMFSYTGLTKEQVDVLRGRYSIYIVRDGRMNMAGLTEANMDRVCKAIAEVVN